MNKRGDETVTLNLTIAECMQINYALGNLLAKESFHGTGWSHVEPYRNINPRDIAEKINSQCFSERKEDEK